MTGRSDFLVEIGTEELPPKALRGMIAAFASAVADGLDEARLGYDDIRPFASPRRLAVLVSSLMQRQEDREVELKGPPVAVAFDKDGAATPAAAAFATKCGVSVDELERRATDKGEWLFHKTVEKGAPTAELVTGIVTRALRQLPIPRPMRWGSGDQEFVRPVHWVVMLLDEQTVSGEILGHSAGNITYGHRFHAPGPMALGSAADYESRLLEEGFVQADPDRRLDIIEKAVIDAATRCGGRPVGERALFEEVAALVEWPVAVVGSFESAFLELPREVVVATLTNHQRYFPVEDASGALLPAFVTVANIDSREPLRVQEGNERVIRPRLADAAFFWDSDRKTRLEDRLEALEGVVYQRGLGSIAERSRRISALAGIIASQLDVDPALAERAGLLSKCDLLTGMVGEFPELQGTMGRHYAEADEEAAEVAVAIEQQYWPRFAGDDIAESGVGRCVAMAEKLDSVCGIFAIGKKPSGNRDPFGLRRSALGVVRTAVEGRLDVDVASLIVTALELQPGDGLAGHSEAVYDFIIERLRAWVMDHHEISAEMFEAVRERRPGSLVDFMDRLIAVRSFVRLASASSLAAANKRIGNILRQAGYGGDGQVDEALLSDAAESRLFSEMRSAKQAVAPLVADRSYTDALARLADLREPVDQFFDDVMVMVDDDRLKMNRLALLAELRDQFLGVADISRLAIK